MATPQNKPAPAPASKPAPAPTPAASSPQEKTVKKSRDKSAAFVKLATKRVNKALASLAQVQALANRRSYTYDAAQVDKIKGAVNGAVEKLVKAFDNAGDSTGGGFSL